RSYYLLPVLPAAALLTARLITTPLAELSMAVRRLLSVGFGTLTVALVVAGLALLPVAWLLPEPWAALPPLPAAPAFAIGWLCCLGLVTCGWRKAALACTATLAMGYVQ